MRLSRIMSYALIAAGPGLQISAARAQQAADRSDSTVAHDFRPQQVQEVAQPDVHTAIDLAGATPVSDSAVFVGAISISGLHKLAPSDFADILTARVGRDQSAADLASLADAIAERVHARGYTFGSARIERQRVANGILVVRVNEGRIDEIRFDGSELPAVRRTLEPLRTGQPVRMEDVERRLLLASDLDGVHIRSSRFIREGDRGILLVSVTKDRIALRVSLSNVGTRPIGPEQARIDVDFNGLLTSDDSLTLSYTATPAQPRELQFGFMRYEKRLNASGTEIALMGSASISRPGAYLTPLNIKNRSWFAAASLMQPLLRRRTASVWLEGQFGLRNVSQWRSGTRLRDDQLAVGRLTLYGYSDVAGGRLRFSGLLSRGFDIFGATGPGDVLASRWDADGTFTTASLWTDWSRDLGAGFSLRLAAQGQLSSQPLLISEEMSLGGSAFLRGYDWGERSGDEGVTGMAELRYLWNSPLGLVKKAQVYAFFDGGSVWNKSSGFGAGSLASTGGGVRVDMTAKLGASFEVGVPLSGARYDTGNETPKLSFGLTSSF